MGAQGLWSGFWHGNHDQRRTDILQKFVENHTSEFNYLLLSENFSLGSYVTYHSQLRLCTLYLAHLLCMELHGLHKC